MAGMSKYLHALSEMSYFYNLEKPGTSGVPDGNFQDTWRLLKLKKKKRNYSGKAGTSKNLIHIRQGNEFSLITKKYKIMHKIGGAHGAENYTGVSCFP